MAAPEPSATALRLARRAVSVRGAYTGYRVEMRLGGDPIVLQPPPFGRTVEAHRRAIVRDLAEWLDFAIAEAAENIGRVGL